MHVSIDLFLTFFDFLADFIWCLVIFLFGCICDETLIVVWIMYVYCLFCGVTFSWMIGGWCCNTSFIVFVVVLSCGVIMIYIMWYYIGVWIFIFIVYSSGMEGYVFGRFFYIIIFYYFLYYFGRIKFVVLVKLGNSLGDIIRLMFIWIDIIVCSGAFMKTYCIFFIFCLPPSLKPCEAVDGSDTRYLNQSYASIVNPILNYIMRSGSAHHPT